MRHHAGTIDGPLLHTLHVDMEPRALLPHPVREVFEPWRGRGWDEDMAWGLEHGSSPSRVVDGGQGAEDVRVQHDRTDGGGEWVHRGVISDSGVAKARTSCLP